MNFYGVTTKLRELLRADINVNTVTYGELDEVALNKFTTYPLAHFNISNVTQGKSNVYDIQLLVMDVLDQSKDTDKEFIRNNNLHDVLNSQEQVGMRLLELLVRGDLRSEGFMLSGSPSFVPFIERFKDDVAGWEVTFSIEVNNEMDICGVDSFNTFIGNGYVNYQTKQAIASAIGISETEISDFTKEGSDIKFNIANPYTIQSSAFFNDRDITSYYDYDDLCTSLGTNAFSGARALENVRFYGVTNLSSSCLRFTHLKKVSFPSAVTSSQFFLRDCFVLAEVNLPLLTPIGQSSADNSCFTSARPGLIVRTNIANQTNNGGDPDGDLEYVTDTLGGTVIYL